MNTKQTLRKKRKARIRARIRGSADRPRLSVHRSNTQLSVQIINDDTGHTILAKSMKGTTKEIAKALGVEIARMCKANNIVRVVFDRAGYRYHGAVHELAQSIREGGITI